MTGLVADSAVSHVLPDCLDVAARNWPNRRALTFGDETWTLRELAQSVAGAAARLRGWLVRCEAQWLDAAGDASVAPTGSVVGATQASPAPKTPAPYSHTHVAHHESSAIAPLPGRIGILAANRPGFVFATHAARHLSGSIVPLNWRQTASEIAWQLEHAAVSVLLVDDERWETATTAAANLPVTIVPIAEIERAAPAVALSRQPRMVPTDQELAVLFTSGTTGRPKGVRLTYGNVWSSAVASTLHLGHHRDDVWLAVLPLFHIGGLSILFRGALTGTPAHLHERFDPDRALAAIDRGATLVSLVPTMLARLLDARGAEEWPRTLRCVLLGGSATPPAVVETCLERNIPVSPTYGLTEASSQVTTLLPSDAAAKAGSSGQPLPLTRLRVMPESGVERTGEPGQIEISGPTVFAGYLGDTDPACHLTPDGWFPTGDIGYLDEESFLTVLDRRDDLIVSGGENISPAEIERVLLDHPQVHDAGVFGENDERWGARPVAAVVWSGAPESATDALADHCRRRLASYKVPDRFVLLAELPRSSSGKLLRRELRERFCASGA